MKKVKTEKLLTLENSPRLRELLINYVSINYEENAIYDDYHLYQEYCLLYNNNELNYLFLAEELTNKCLKMDTNINDKITIKRTQISVEKDALHKQELQKQLQKLLLQKEIEDIKKRMEQL